MIWSRRFVLRYSTVLKSKTEEQFKWQLFSGSFYMTLVKRENVESNILAVRSLSRSKICNNHCSRLVTGIFVTLSHFKLYVWVFVRWYSPIVFIFQWALPEVSLAIHQLFDNIHRGSHVNDSKYFFTLRWGNIRGWPKERHTEVVD